MTTKATPAAAPPSLRRLALGAALILLGVAGAMAALVAVLSGIGGRGGGTGSGLQIVSPGMPAPDFTLRTADGRSYHLADYTGRAVFLAFVPSWTDPKTVAEARSLKGQIRNFDDAGAKVMLVSGDSAPAAEKLAASEKLPFPLLLDGGNKLAKSWGVPQGDFRTTFVVNPSGKVKYRLTDAAVDAAHHGPQLLSVSKCCVDDVMAARAHGIGKAVGDFSLPRVDIPGRPMTTLYGSGPATVVLFLSAKCPCSNAYNERVRALAQRYAGRGVRFVGVYANQDETIDEITKHARQHGFPFPILKDDRALCADHFGASVTPEVFVVDAGHVLRYAGRIDDNREAAQVKTRDLAAALDALAAGKPPAQGDTRAFGCAIVREALPAG